MSVLMIMHQLKVMLQIVHIKSSKLNSILIIFFIQISIGFIMIVNISPIDLISNI